MSSQSDISGLFPSEDNPCPEGPGYPQEGGNGGNQ